jgi:hypothetical protein
MNDDQQTSEDQLARLADGSLPASRARELRAQVEASPQLAAALDEQQRAVSLLRAIDVPAPQSLRARIEQMSDQGAPLGTRRPPWRFSPPGRFARSLTLPIAIGLAIVAAAIVIVQGRGATAPTVAQTARLTLAAATLPAPAVDPADQLQLQLRVDGVAFPDWYASKDYKTAGAREDTLRGRRIVTVFYAGRGERIGYAIVSGPRLRQIAGHPVLFHGVSFTQARTASVSLVTWVRAGHTCVISAKSVDPRILLELAEYRS